MQPPDSRPGLARTASLSAFGGGPRTSKDGGLITGGKQDGPRGKRLPNRTSFRPGVCPNPGGQPKGRRISTWLLELGSMTPAQLAKAAPSLPANGQIAVALITAAMGKGGERATEIILDRTEGKVVQPVSGEISDTRRIVLVFPEAAK